MGDAAALAGPDNESQMTRNRKTLHWHGDGVQNVQDAKIKIARAGLESYEDTT
jgi:hypothetical protein